MDERKYLPNTDQLGVLISTILLAFALSHLIEAPKNNVPIQLPGFFFPVPLDMPTAMRLLTAGLAATGMDWLLRSHPALHKRATFQWWILPTLTTFVVSVPLSILPHGAPWGIGFVIGGVLIFFVFLAEYIVVDPGAPYYTTAIAGLTAISYTLFFILAVALRYSEARLYILLPALFLAAGLASLRMLHLRFSGRWEYAWSAGIAFVCVQIAAGLHYWRLSPVQFGLMLVGPLYGLANLASNLGEDQPARRAAIEPVMAMALCWGVAFFIR